MYVYIGFKTFSYVIRHLDYIASFLLTVLHLGFFHSRKITYVLLITLLPYWVSATIHIYYQESEDSCYITLYQRSDSPSPVTSCSATNTLVDNEPYTSICREILKSCVSARP
jgi:hypothetical protein